MPPWAWALIIIWPTAGIIIGPPLGRKLKLAHAASSISTADVENWLRSAMGPDAPWEPSLSTAPPPAFPGPWGTALEWDGPALAALRDAPTALDAVGQLERLADTGDVHLAHLIAEVEDIMQAHDQETEDYLSHLRTMFTEMRISALT